MKNVIQPSPYWKVNYAPISKCVCSCLISLYVYITVHFHIDQKCVCRNRTAPIIIVWWRESTHIWNWHARMNRTTEICYEFWAFKLIFPRINFISINTNTRRNQLTVSNVLHGNNEIIWRFVIPTYLQVLILCQFSKRKKNGCRFGITVPPSKLVRNQFDGYYLFTYLIKFESNLFIFTIHMYTFY